MSRECARGGGKQYLQRTAEKGNSANRLEVSEGDFEPQGEEEQGHADFGEEFDVMDLGNSWPGSVGTNDDAGRDVAYEEGQAKESSQQTAEKSGDDDENKILCDAQLRLSR